MKDKTKQNIGLFGIIGVVASLFSILGIEGIPHLLNLFNNKEPMIYQGTVQDKDDPNKYIAGAKITFLGYQNEIPTCETDDYGLFSIQLPKEYPTIKIRITHDDYISIEQNKKLTKTTIQTPDNFQLVPTPKDKPPPVSPGSGQPETNGGKGGITSGNAHIKPEPKLLRAVYFESEEKNFTQPSTIIANRLKSALSTEGYSFTDNRAQARFRLKITATTRHHGTEYGLTICYADVTVGLFDVNNNKSVFQDVFSQKGISSTREAAGRKALEDAVPMIANKVPTWSEIIGN